jgi:hypothetical protein
MFRIVFSTLVGMTFGALAGGTVCVVIGLLWLNTVGTNCLDELCMVDALADMVSSGVIAGGAVGAALLAGLTAQNRRRRTGRYSQSRSN